MNVHELPFQSHQAFDPSIIYPLWMCIVFLIIIGWDSFWLKVINYVCSVLVFSSLRDYEYHIFYTYVGVNFLFLFLPLSKVFSLNSLIKRVKNNRIFLESDDIKVPVVYYYLPVFVGITLIYFDSVFYKLDSQMWLKGLGMWLPSNVPFTTWTKPTFVSNIEWLVKLMSYTTVVFEAIFIFLFWFRPFRVPLLVMGVSLHIGILIEFPIPLFALCFVSLYLLMVPIGFWGWFVDKSPNFLMVYNPANRSVVRLVALFASLDIFGRIQFMESGPTGKEEFALEPSESMAGFWNQHKIPLSPTLVRHMVKKLGWAYPLVPLSGLFYALISSLFKNASANSGGAILAVKAFDTALISPTFFERVQVKFAVGLLLLFFVFQLLITLSSPYARVLARSTGLQTTLPYKLAIGWSISLFKYYHTLLGVGHHDVFVDSHFAGYNHSLKICYEKPDGSLLTLPIISDESMPTGFVTGTLWACYTFRTNGPEFQWKIYKSSSLRFIRVWADENQIPIENQRFKIFVTKVRLPTDWEKDFFEKTVKGIKWDLAATLSFGPGGEVRYDSVIPDIEKY